MRWKILLYESNVLLRVALYAQVILFLVFLSISPLFVHLGHSLSRPDFSRVGLISQTVKPTRQGC